jgi:mannitol-1-/sugar-/sorbitol-6-phosphatase
VQRAEFPPVMVLVRVIMLRPWIFFDLDGTLADSIPVLKQVYVDFLTRYDARGSEQEFDELNGASLGEIIRFTRGRYGLSASEHELKEAYLELLCQAYRERVLPMEGASEVIQTLHGRGYRLMLVTAGPRAMAEEFIRARGWDTWFVDCVFGDEVKRAKPAGDIFLLALERAGVCSQEVTVVEDSVNGVRAALAAGLQVVVCGQDSVGLFSDEVVRVQGLNELLDLQERPGGCQATK